MTKIGFAGDWHGNLLHAEIALEKLAVCGVKHVFQLGDFGLFGSQLRFSGDKYRQKIQRVLERYSMELYVTLGNHENYDLFEKLPREHGDDPRPGFRREPEADRIRYFERGAGFQLFGLNFLSLGGAASIDFERRLKEQAMKGASKQLWEQELITQADVEATLKTAEELGHVDVMLAHDVFARAHVVDSHRTSGGWGTVALSYAQQTRDTLQEVVRIVKPELWMHGHYHVAAELETLMGDINGEAFSVKSVCLDMDTRIKSLALMEPSTKELTVF